jgi:hypothetical protein
MATAKEMLRQARELRENLEARETAHTREEFEALYRHYCSLPEEELKRVYDEVVGPPQDPPEWMLKLSPDQLVRLHKESL